MNHFTEQLVVVISAIIGLAIVAVLVSNRAQTADVITAGGAALANDISAAVAPVTGATAQINTGGGFSGLGAPIHLPFQ